MHAGSALAALISWLDARLHQGQWLLRFEDVDHERCQPRYADVIRTQLETLSLHWDAELPRQSTRLPRYREIVDSWIQDGSAYACICTRKDLASFRQGGETRYPGTCRNRKLPLHSCSIRFRIPEDSTLRFEDSNLGLITQNVAEQCGDFVIQRRTGDFSYQLAVSVDDADQNITHVVRGEDLLPSTGRQILLLKKLKAHIPVYRHHRILLDKDGAKISKSTGAEALDLRHPSRTLCQTLRLAGIDTPQTLEAAAPQEVLAFALENYKKRIPPRISPD